jgi:D-alanyl-D-alanine carboxypeptidase/D-alanyl-D-alanine-endopeptidase (penicillin-binding protein 4)
MARFRYLKEVALGGTAGFAALALVIGGMALFGSGADIDDTQGAQASDSQPLEPVEPSQPAATAEPEPIEPDPSEAAQEWLDEELEAEQAELEADAGGQEPEAEATTDPSASPSATPSAAPSPSCNLSTLATVPEILDWRAEVVNTANGQVLYSSRASDAARTASVMKILTSVVVLETLGADYRVTTRVYQDASDPGRIFFVGAGDITLSRTEPGKQSVYRDAPKLSSLASQIRAALGGTEVHTIVLDSSLWSASNGDGEWHDTWDPRGLTEGYMAPVSALQVDADRDNPARQSSPRSQTPVMRAGEWLREAIGDTALNATLRIGTVPTSAVQVASVQSQPMSRWISYMMASSDNALAEAMGRLVAIDLGRAGSMSSLTPAFQAVLSPLGVRVNDIFIQDASGLSRNSLVSPLTVNQVLALVDSSSRYQLVRSSLSTAGQPGSLGTRFRGDQADAHGRIFAKTGWIRTGYSLAGFINARDGSRLAFTVYNLGSSVRLVNRDAMDNMVYAMFDCGLRTRG